MKYYIIAGEASGDLHASSLMKNLKALDGKANFRFWGGDLMQREGGTMVKHFRETAFMGFSEVVLNLRTILKNISLCTKDIFQYKPDALILIDYPGFNLRIAKVVHGRGIKVFYYISPQIWAWHRSRIKGIKKYIDRMFVILPFEKEFYHSYGLNVDYVGHPLLDVIDRYRRIDNETMRNDFTIKYGLTPEPVIALLPGSRIQEIEKVLPVMLTVHMNVTGYQFVIAGVSSVPEILYRKILLKTGRSVPLVMDDTYRLLSMTHAAMVTSGTATLETALFRVPELVCYKGNPVSYYIARQLVKVKYISLVNLIMDSPVIHEFIQKDMTVKNVSAELSRIVSDNDYRKKMINDFDILSKKLGGHGASHRAAKLMIEYLKISHTGPIASS